MFHPKKASDYSAEEKVQKFDEFHRYALDIFDFTLSNRYEMKDAPQYAYEMFLDLLGEGVWNEFKEALQERGSRL